MNTTVLFNIDKKLKTAAMRKARAKGLTLTSVFTMTMQAFVDDMLTVDILARDIAKARQEFKEGKFFTQAQIEKGFDIT